MLPAKLSRSKVELFVECPHCFYLDVAMRHPRPAGFPFTLNNAVDALLKREFDHYRIAHQQHPIQLSNGVDWLPAPHPSLDQWRNALAGGVAYDHPLHGIRLYGAIDDLWVNPQGVYAVVDYKATARDTPVTELPVWATGYSRQLSFYQWLLRRNGLQVTNTGYFVYATANPKRPMFNSQLEFDLRLIPVECDDTWIEPTLEALVACLKKSEPPASAVQCGWCNYRKKLS